MGLSKNLRSGEKEEDKKNGAANASTASFNTGLVNSEYPWACELTSDSSEFKWTVDEEELDEDDEDYIQHRLILKSICLGVGAVSGQENIVVLESVGANGQPVITVIANLTRGVTTMCSPNLVIEGKCGATFKLAEGAGPVHICGNEILDYPQHDLDGSQMGESKLEETEDDQDQGDEDEDEEDDEDDESFDIEQEKEKSKAKPGKRKAANDDKMAKQGKKPKMATKDEEEDEEEEMEEEDEESDSEDAAPKKSKKDTVKTAKQKAKSPSVQNVSKKTGKKGKK